MIIFIPFEVVAEEEKGRIGEDGWTGFALFNKLLQFFYCCCVHPSDIFCFWERESACRGFLIYEFLSKWKWIAACLFFIIIIIIIYWVFQVACNYIIG
jgi:hypothetical protein